MATARKQYTYHIHTLGPLCGQMLDGRIYIPCDGQAMMTSRTSSNYQSRIMLLYDHQTVLRYGVMWQPGDWSVAIFGSETWISRFGTMNEFDLIITAPLVLDQATRGPAFSGRLFLFHSIRHT